MVQTNLQQGNHLTHRDGGGEGVLQKQCGPHRPPPAPGLNSTEPEHEETKDTESE